MNYISSIFNVQYTKSLLMTMFKHQRILLHVIYKSKRTQCELKAMVSPCLIFLWARIMQNAIIAIWTYHAFCYNVVNSPLIPDIKNKPKWKEYKLLQKCFEFVCLVCILPIKRLLLTKGPINDKRSHLGTKKRVRHERILYQWRDSLPTKKRATIVYEETRVDKETN